MPQHHTTPLTFEALKASCSPGGASVLTSVCRLAPAVGPHGTVAPAKYLSGKGSSATPVYAYTPTVVDGTVANAVILSSKQDQAHRRQTALSAAMRDEHHPAHAVMKRVPRITLQYEGSDEVYTDFDLPHRFSDGHIRAGRHDSKPVTATEAYRAARDATPRNMTALFNLSPISNAHGAWDASRRSNQLRQPSTMVSEIVGVLADQGEHSMKPLPRGAARVDPITASVQLTAAEAKAIADRQKNEMSEKTLKKLSKASELGLGHIPPSLESIGLVSCTEIIRSTVLSFATLRQLRFGGSGEQDIAFRTVLAALTLLGMALSDDELYIRANCHLIEAGEPEVKLDGRYGRSTQLDPVTPELAIDLLSQAYAYAEQVGDFKWNGQVFDVVGDPVILAKSVADDPDA
ncbi:MAG: type I-U CRISPR-associated protein Cas7 [Propioniciclava sp.]|uniref:type I-G CRISPR-associated protein Cas7 n=1 Tax=Propioniciclava sp. TaxID=2038686 RepID=UPI0039E6D248